MRLLRTLLISGLMMAVVASAETPAVKAFGLGEVELLDSPFKLAMERNAQYLLRLDADRLLHNVRKYAGLNHTKYGAAIYFHSADALYVNLFIPSVLRWQERGLQLEQRTHYPRDNRTSLTVIKGPSNATVVTHPSAGVGGGGGDLHAQWQGDRSQRSAGLLCHDQQRVEQG